jgi:beta-N-acetylhexosaminidase
MAALNAGCDLVLLCNQSAHSEGQAIDAMLDGLEQARKVGKWRPSEASEQRRLSLLPSTAPLSWDALMAEPRYMQALDLLP